MGCTGETACHAFIYGACWALPVEAFQSSDSVRDGKARYHGEVVEDLAVEFVWAGRVDDTGCEAWNAKGGVEKVAD